MIEIAIRDKKSRVIPTIEDSISILDMLGSIRWSNVHDCPSGYEWNEEGWVITNEYHMRITFNMLPFMLPLLGEYQLIYQNALALRCLNNKQMDVVAVLIKYRFRNSYGYEASEEVLYRAVEDAYAIEDISVVLSSMSDKIFAYRDVWISKDCTNDVRRKAGRIIRDRYLDEMRSFMTIDTKYKTREVAEFTEESIYAVKSYWDDTGLTKKLRTTHSILEAIELLVQEGIVITQAAIADVAGISIPTASKVIDRSYIKQLNTSINEG